MGWSVGRLVGRDAGRTLIFIWPLKMTKSFNLSLGRKKIVGKVITKSRNSRKRGKSRKSMKRRKSRKRRKRKKRRKKGKVGRVGKVGKVEKVEKR